MPNFQILKRIQKISSKVFFPNLRFMFLRYEVVVADCLHDLKYFDDCEFFVGCPILFEEKGGQVGPVVDDAAAESTEN